MALCHACAVWVEQSIDGTVMCCVSNQHCVVCHVSSVSVSTARRTFCFTDFVNRRRMLVIKLSSTYVSHFFVFLTPHFLDGGTTMVQKLGDLGAKGIKVLHQRCQGVGNGEGIFPSQPIMGCIWGSVISCPSRVRVVPWLKLNFVQSECQRNHLVACIALNFHSKQRF